MPNNSQFTTESTLPCGGGTRRWSFWAWHVLAYAVALVVAVYFLHEDVPTTVIGIVIFTAGWVLSAYVYHRWRPKLPDA
jgi:hypothetical protein